MVFKIDQLSEYSSNGITLLPGEVIFTGTPMGVAEFTGAPLKNAISWKQKSKASRNKGIL
jgi:2-keto-4-pentenoate hydratase/2-oxohepta-3-ene-1,7-dioic acid hydratase in catechol pathway